MNDIHTHTTNQNHAPSPLKSTQQKTLEIISALYFTYTHIPDSIMSFTPIVHYPLRYTQSPRPLPGQHTPTRTQKRERERARSPEGGSPEEEKKRKYEQRDESFQHQTFSFQPTPFARGKKQDVVQKRIPLLRPACFSKRESSY